MQAIKDEILPFYSQSHSSKSTPFLFAIVWFAKKTLSSKSVFKNHLVMTKNLFFLILVAFLACESEPDNSKTRPKVQDITESVYASLEVLPYQSYYAQSVVSGIIDSLAIRKGDEVQKGDLICKIKADNARTRLRDAQISLQKTKDDYLGENNLLKNLKLEIETARQQLEWDSLQYTRLKRLWDQKIGSENNLQQAELKYETTQNQLKVLQKKYKQSRNDLEKAYEMASNRLKGERTTLSDFTVRALMDGRVYELHKEVGELISPQERIAEIGSRDSFKIEMDVDEVDVARISLRDTALVTLDAYPKEVYEAVILSVLPKKNAQNLTYTVRAQFIDPPELLYGLSGEANIIVGKRSRALTLPPEYLHTDHSVMTEEGEQSVEVGMKNLKFVEILSGIDSSTVVIKPE